MSHELVRIAKLFLAFAGSVPEIGLASIIFCAIPEMAKRRPHQLFPGIAFLGRFLAGIPQIIERDGLYWYVEGRREDYLPFLQEEPIKPFLKRWSVPGKHFLDIGAHVGLYSLLAARLGMRVYCWEPDPRNMVVLKKNLKLNDLSATIYEEALGEKTYTAFLQNKGGRSKISDEGRVKVEVRQLDDWKLDNVHMVKIDVEGYETRVLLGATDTLERCKPVLLIELHDFYDPLAERKCVEILRRLDYRTEKLSRTCLKYLIATPNTSHF